MALAYSDISRVLGAARRRQARVVVATALGWGAAAAVASLLAGAAGLAYGPTWLTSWLRPAALVLAAVAALGASLWAAWGLWRGAWGPAEAARTVSREDPVLRSALLSSVELARERDALERTGSLSVALVDEHIARTADRAVTLDLGRAVPSRPARQAGFALLAAVALEAAAFLFLGPNLGRGYSRLFTATRAQAAAPRQDPITGDIEITYLYPAYMARPEKKVPGTGGDVTAPRGTEVRLATRSDRPVSEAQIAVASFGPAAASSPVGARADESSPPRPLEPTQPQGPARRAYALHVEGGRDLTGSFVVDDGGSYRFQFLDRGRVKVSGPPIPIVVEPDAFPEVRITSPAGEVEVDAGSSVHVEWTASDDFGLSELALVLKPPAGEEQRRPVRTFESARRESGSFELELGSLHLAEGEKLLYWLEVKDNDAVSGPKRAASSTHAVKISSEAEHHRHSLELARKEWEDAVRLLGDRLEQLLRHQGSSGDPERLARGEALDTRARQLHEHMRETAAAMRKDRSAPKEIPAALANVAQGIRVEEQRLTTARQTLSRWLRFDRAGDPSFARRVDELDESMNRELEKDVLYLEQLFDKRRAEDLVRMAKDLASRRRDLASLLERYKQAPTDQAKKELLAEISRLKSRMQDMLRQMGELARGVSDEHMNAEAMAEMAKSQDLMGGMKRVEDLLAKGDIDAAMKELDAMGSALQQMLSSLERTAGVPDERNAALTKQMLEFKRDLESVQREQEKVAGETERVKAEYRKAVAERMKRAEEATRKLEELARKARDELRQSHAGTSPRSEDDYSQAKDRIDDLQRALALRDLDAALEVSKRAMPPLQRLAGELESDAFMAERYASFQRRDPGDVREAARHAKEAIPPTRKVREELERLFPDPRTVLPRGEQQKLDRLAREQQGLEEQAGKLQKELESLMQAAPIFPPQAGQSLGEGRGHMQAAAEELGRKNPQRGHGQQREAMEALGRLQKGLEEMAKKGQGGGGGGFPFPFAEAGSPHGEGAEGEPSREKVEIPQADLAKGEQFRRDLLEAMKQGTPEPYRGEVKRYYEELVK